MMNEKVLQYVDEVISKVTAPEEFKIKLENQLIRHIINASKYTSVDDVLTDMGSPEKLADEMSRISADEQSSYNMKLDRQNMKPAKISDNDSHEPAPMRNHHSHMAPRIYGEYMRQESNVNIKLLYIPLIQICSDVEVIRMPLTDEYYFERPDFLKNN